MALFRDLVRLLKHEINQKRCHGWLLHMLHRVEIPDAAALLERQRSLQKMVERAPLLAKVKQIVAARTQFGGLPRQERLVQAAIQTGMVA